MRIAADKSSGDGWFLLRLSLHDPVLPLNLQSDSKGGVAHMAAKILEFIKQFEQLEYSSLSKLATK